MRKRRSNSSRKGAIIVFVAVGLITLLMSSCLVLDYILWKTSVTRLKNSCELAEISANNALVESGLRLGNEDANSLWIDTAKRILKGNGVSEEELAKSRIKVRKDGSIEMTVFRNLQLLHPQIWRGQHSASAGLSRESLKEPSREVRENRPHMAKKLDDREIEEEESAEEMLEHGRLPTVYDPVDVAASSKDERAQVVRPKGVGSTFDDAPSWWVPVLDYGYLESRRDDEKTVTRVKRFNGQRLNGVPHWYPESEPWRPK